MESTLNRTVKHSNTRRTETILYWIVTGLFCLQIGFTAYAQLRLPQVAEAFAHLGFPDYFRVELSLAKFVGVLLLVAPVRARLKEWARSAMGRRHGAGRRPPVCSGASRTFSGAACRPRGPALRMGT